MSFSLLLQPEKRIFPYLYSPKNVFFPTSTILCSVKNNILVNSSILYTVVVLFHPTGRQYNIVQYEMYDCSNNNRSRYMYKFTFYYLQKRKKWIESI